MASFTMVVGYDGSEPAKRALDEAVKLATLIPGARIMIACSAEVPTPAMLDGLGIGYEELSEKAVKGIQRALDEAAAVVTSAGIQVATECRAESAVEAITDVAKNENADMIVVGVGHRRFGVLGSTSQKVLHRHEGIPVLLV